MAFLLSQNFLTASLSALKLRVSSRLGRVIADVDSVPRVLGHEEFIDHYPLLSTHPCFRPETPGVPLITSSRPASFLIYHLFLEALEKGEARQMIAMQWPYYYTSNSTSYTT